MKIKNIALIILSTLIMMGCEQVQMLQTAPGIQTGNNNDSLMPTKTRWALYTSTPLVTETPEPVIPTYAPVSGWQKFGDDDYEIYLPGSYLGGNTNDTLEQIVANFRKMGGNYKWIADTIEQNPDMYVLYATDANAGPSGFITNLGITTDTILPTFSVEAYMSSAMAGLPAQFQIVDKKTTVINGYEVGQIIVEFELNNIKGKELLYIFKGESSAWIMTFATGADEYNSRLLEFVQIADSFRIKSE